MALTERLAIVLETVGGKAAAGEFEKLANASKGLASSTGKAGGGLAGLGSQLQGLVTGPAGLSALTGVAAAAASGLVAFATNAVATWTELGQQVIAFQRASGATAEQSSALIAAFDDVGISAETGSKAIFQLGKRLGENGSKLAGFGVVAAKDARGNTDLAATLKGVADAYRRTADPAQRAELLTAAFGKTGQDLIPILERGSAGIDALFAGAADTGQIFTQQDLQRVEDYRIAMDNLDDAVREVSLNAGQSLVPALADTADAFATVITKLNDIGQSRAWQLLEKPIGGLISPAIGAANAAGKLFGIFDSGASSTAKIEREIRETADAVDLLDKTLTVAVGAQDRLANSQRGLADARGDLNKLLKEGAVDEEKVADAVRSHDSAVRSLGHAHREQADAQEAYNEALADFQRSGSDDAADRLADARNNLADADDAVANAQDRAQESQAALDKARAGDPNYQEKLATARQHVADAESAVGTNTLANIGAHQAETTALAGKVQVAQALLDKYTALIRIAPDAASALAPLIGAVLPTATGGSHEGNVLSAAPQLGYKPAAPTTTTQTINVNVSQPVAASPTGLAQAIMWALK